MNLFHTNITIYIYLYLYWLHGILIYLDMVVFILNTATVQNVCVQQSFCPFIVLSFIDPCFSSLLLHSRFRVLNRTLCIALDSQEVYFVFPWLIIACHKCIMLQCSGWINTRQTPTAGTLRFIPSLADRSSAGQINTLLSFCSFQFSVGSSRCRLSSVSHSFFSLAVCPAILQR